MLTKQEMENLQDDLNKLFEDDYFIGYDGPPDDRLFGENMYHFDADLTLSESKYNKVIQRINNTHLTTKKYSIYFGYDVSGYDYWYKKQEEPNYIHLTIAMNDSKNVDAKKLASDIQKCISKLSDKLKRILPDLDYEYEMGLSNFSFDK